VQSSVEPDAIAAAASPLVARIAAGAIVASGALDALTGIQTMLVVTIRGPLELMPYALIVVGVAAFATGVMVYRARFSGAVAATVACALAMFVTMGWGAIAFTHGLYSLFALLAPFFSMAAMVAAALSIAPCKRASDARATLASQGLDLGL
jgi:hypothetical protein